MMTTCPSFLTYHHIPRCTIPALSSQLQLKALTLHTLGSQLCHCILNNLNKSSSYQCLWDPVSVLCPSGWLAPILVVTGSPIRAWPLQEDVGIPHLRAY